MECLVPEKKEEKNTKIDLKIDMHYAFFSFPLPLYNLILNPRLVYQDCLLKLASRFSLAHYLYYFTITVSRGYVFIVILA